MLTRLREIVEKVAAAASLTDALDLLVNETCLAMDTEVCSIYLADNDRRCYYLMATRGLKSRAGALSHWRLTRASSGWSAAGPSLSTWPMPKATPVSNTFRR